MSVSHERVKSMKEIYIGGSYMENCENHYEPYIMCHSVIMLSMMEVIDMAESLNI